MPIQEGPILTEFLNANMFRGLGKFESVVYLGAVTPKLIRFILVNGESEKTLFLASIISSQEKLMWQSFQELLESSLKLASAGLQGIYGLDLFSADIEDSTRHFKLQDFSALLINHGRKLNFGEQKHIRYGQIFSILHKRAPADWGKIDLNHHVEIMNPEKTSFSSFVKKMMKQTDLSSPRTRGSSDRLLDSPFQGNDTMFFIHDLGRNLVWNLEGEEYPASVHYYKSVRD